MVFSVSGLRVGGGAVGCLDLGLMLFKAQRVDWPEPTTLNPINPINPKPENYKP